MTERFPTIVPSRSTRLTVAADITEVRFGLGRRQRIRRDGIRLDWHVVFADRPTEIIDVIDVFLRARGGVESFIWAPPGQGSRIYSCTRWQITPVNSMLASLKADFIETI